jgi:methylase of polypeptide subunit release factors
MHPWTLYKRGLMSFWYWYVRKLNALWPSITVAGKSLTVYPGVYKPIENEQVAAAYCDADERVLDLGCGSGVCTVFAAERAREVVAVDISPTAVANTAENCRRHGLANVSVAESDMFANVEGAFDVILANPPYIAADFEDGEEQFATSVRFLPVLFAQAGGYLAPGGRLIVQFPLWFRGKIERLAAQHGFSVTEVRRMPAKPLDLQLLSLAYLQVGFRSSLFVIEPKTQTAGSGGGGASGRPDSELAA